MRRPPRVSNILLPTFLLLCCGLPAPRAGEEPDADPEIDRLIGRLGNPEWSERERAARELVASGDRALVPLAETTLTGTDLEIRSRARSLIAGILTGEGRTEPEADDMLLLRSYDMSPFERYLTDYISEPIVPHPPPPPEPEATIPEAEEIDCYFGTWFQIMIEVTIEPEFWSDARPITILPNGRMLVRAPARIHHQIEMLLDAIAVTEAQAFSPVRIEARFLEIPESRLRALMENGPFFDAQVLDRFEREIGTGGIRNLDSASLDCLNTQRVHITGGMPGGPRVRLECRPTIEADGERITVTFQAERTGNGTHFATASTFTVRSGETVLLAGAGTEFEETDSGRTVLLIRPVIGREGLGRDESEEERIGIHDWIDRLVDPSPRVRQEARLWLLKAGDGALRSLAEAAADEGNPDRRRRARETLLELLGARTDPEGMPIRVYDVFPLCQSPVDYFSDPLLPPGEAPVGRERYEEPRLEEFDYLTPEDIELLIEEHVSPDFWMGQEGASIEVTRNGLLVVRATHDIHRGIVALLAAATPESARMVSVRGRFLTIPEKDLAPFLRLTGSLDGEQRAAIERGIDEGRIRALGGTNLLLQDGQRTYVRQDSPAGPAVRLDCRAGAEAGGRTVRLDVVAELLGTCREGDGGQPTSIYRIATSVTLPTDGATLIAGAGTDNGSPDAGRVVLLVESAVLAR